MDIQDQCAELTRESLDNIIFGQVMSSIHMEGTVGSRYRHTPVPRGRTRMSFAHHGHSICKGTFLQLHGIGKYTYSISIHITNIP